jgi:RNA recognition motif-containing protein
MNLNCAFTLFLASVSAVAGFAPGATPRLMAANTAQLKTRVASSLLSETTDAAESDVVDAVATVEESAAEAVADEAPKEPEYDTSIYVGNISFECTEDEIRSAFSAHGEVKKVTLPTDKFTGRPRGFGFVQMADADATAAAIAALNEVEMNGRTIFVSESLPKDQVQKKKVAKRRSREEKGSKIYVGNLNFDTTAETLEAAFKEYGNVIECFLPVDYDGNPRGFAFVSMEEEDAVKAIEGLNQVELDGRTLTVNKSLPRGEKAPTQTPNQTKLYVGNLSWGTEEGALRELFEEYGTVIDCYIPVDRETGQHRGFAFVTMGPDDALRAADETDGYELDGRILRVNEAQAKGSSPRRSNDGYDGGDAYDEQSDESWGNDAY